MRIMRKLLDVLKSKESESESQQEVWDALEIGASQDSDEPQENSDKFLENGIKEKVTNGSDETGSQTAYETQTGKENTVSEMEDLDLPSMENSEVSLICKREVRGDEQKVLSMQSEKSEVVRKNVYQEMYEKSLEAETDAATFTVSQFNPQGNSGEDSATDRQCNVNEEQEIPPAGDEEVEEKTEKTRLMERREAEDIARKRLKEYYKKLSAEYVFPPMDALQRSEESEETPEYANRLQETLDSFGVRAKVSGVIRGSRVNRYELSLENGEKIKRVISLMDDIKLILASDDVRILIPVPGKNAIGIEVPNTSKQPVTLRDLLESDKFKNHPSKLLFAIGEDIEGKPVIRDVTEFPHLLIVGITGSGKSVCVNALIMSILYKAHPDEVKLIMIDPKVVELSVYNGIPHLFIPVVTDSKKAAGVLNWCVAEMTDRYNKFAEFGVRDLEGYNKKIEALEDIEDENKPKKLPQVVIIIDELADIMTDVSGEAENSILRLLQLGHTAGIHLIITTRTVSSEVVPKSIINEMPSRIALRISSKKESWEVIETEDARMLLGEGDMLFKPQYCRTPVRIQGSLVIDEEVSNVVDFLKAENITAGYWMEIEEQIAKVQHAVSAARGDEDTDALFADAGKFIIEKDKASIGMLQRMFKIGFNRAARIMDQLLEAGVVGPEEGTRPRKILMSVEEFEAYLEEL